MTKRLSLAFLAISVLGLSGCATSLKPDYNPPVGWTGPVSSFALMPAAADELNQAAAAMVRAGLTAHGWQERAEGAQWQVGVSYAERPAAVGLYSDQSSAEGEWVLPPRRPPFWSRGRSSYSLQIILTDPVRQQGPFVSQARVLDRKGRADVVLPHLVEATVEGLGR